MYPSSTLVQIDDYKCVKSLDFVKTDVKIINVAWTLSGTDVFLTAPENGLISNTFSVESWIAC